MPNPRPMVLRSFRRPHFIEGPRRSAPTTPCSSCGRFDGRTSLRGDDDRRRVGGAYRCGRFDGRTSLRAADFAQDGVAVVRCGRFDGRTSLRGADLPGRRVWRDRCGRFDGRTSLRAVQADPAAGPCQAGCGRFDGRTSLRAGRTSWGRRSPHPRCGRFDGRTSLRGPTAGLSALGRRGLRSFRRPHFIEGGTVRRWSSRDLRRVAVVSTAALH